MNLKRNLILIVLIPFMVLTIGAYYIQASSSKLPNFSLQLKEGSAKEVEGVTVHGQYGQSPINEPVDISAAGSEYLGERSFLERIAPTNYGSKELARLIKEHRQFMRGKRDPRCFYEDEHILVYVNVKSDRNGLYEAHNFRFTVAILDKKQKDDLSFDVPVPKENAYTDVRVEDVQMNGMKLLVVTDNNYKMGDGKAQAAENERHVYSLDMSRQTVAEDRKIKLNIKEEPGVDTNIGIVDDMDVTQPSDYLVYYASQSEVSEKNDDGSYTTRDVGGQLVAYHLQTGAQFQIQTPESTLLRENATMDGNRLYLAETTDQGVSVISYSLKERKTVSDISLPLNELLPGPINAESPTLSTERKITVGTLKISRGRLYVLVKAEGQSIEPPLLAIADLDTGKLVYKGIVTVKGNKNDQDKYLRSLFAYDLNIT